MEYLDHQDWNKIIVNKQNKNNKSSNNLEDPKKKLSESQQKDIKLLKQVDNDELKHKKVPTEIRKQIQQKRCSLKWTQKDLGQRTNLQVSIINEIETGKAIYNPQHINKIKRALGIQ